VSSHAEHISGLVERVIFHSAESGFAVLRVKARGHRDLVTVVGTAPTITVGEWIEATGTWRIDSQYGQQLRANVLHTTPPTTPEGIAKYLGSGLIKGIGPHFADKLVKAFGMEVFEVIEQSPERMLEVEGITHTLPPVCMNTFVSLPASERPTRGSAPVPSHSARDAFEARGAVPPRPISITTYRLAA
jgi:ATP-dependent exoDNAse (exonuclease V) alpha subunit